jgi:dTDP-4-amino-4,6-dideoxygalactose transaminase
MGTTDIMGTTDMGMTELQAAGVGTGDEVVVPAFGGDDVVRGVRALGATPVYADIDPRTYCLSAESAARAVTHRTVAVVAIDLFGHPVDLSALQAVAHAHGVRLVGPQLVSAPSVSSVSPVPSVEVRRRREHAAHLSARLTGVVPPVDVSAGRHTYTSFVVRVPGNGRPDRDAFRLALRNRGVRAEVPVKVPGARLPEAARAADETLALPVDAALTRRDLQRVVSVCNSLGGLLYEAV